ncbi:MAG: nuclear transport factor 2 family protein [Chthoniobacterales bacterium]|nr:nuclear transport factor 2 family protein [Chthoniobacterales bacterium]
MKPLKPLLAVTLLACVVVPCALVQASPTVDGAADSAAISTKLKQMEKDWGDALLEKDHGVAVVSGLVADDYAGINSKGKMQNKTALLDELKNDTLSSSTIDSTEVHVYGAHIATVCGTSTEAGKGKNGKSFTHHYGWADTWMERDGKWQCIAEAGMILPEK